MEIPLFNRCYPDKTNFNDVIKVKDLNDWHGEYIRLDCGIDYWIMESPFYDDGIDLYRNLVSQFPIVHDTNTEGCKDANPFATIHLPQWCCQGIFVLLENYFSRYLPYYIKMDYFEWGNLYFKDQSKPYDYFRLPHCDGPNGIVSNLWFTNHSELDSGTILYKYHGKVIKGPDNKLYYDYQADKNHPLFDEAKELFLSRKRLGHWTPLTTDEEIYWGFERVAILPSKYGTMTVYNTEISHTPFISQNCNFRWSHAYSINYTQIL